MFVPHSQLRFWLAPAAEKPAENQIRLSLFTFYVCRELPRHPFLIDRKKWIDRFKPEEKINKDNAGFLLNRTCEVGAVDYCQRRLQQLTAPVTKSNYCGVLKADSNRTG